MQIISVLRVQPDALECLSVAILEEDQLSCWEYYVVVGCV